MNNYFSDLTNQIDFEYKQFVINCQGIVLEEHRTPKKIRDCQKASHQLQNSLMYFNNMLTMLKEKK